MYEQILKSFYRDYEEESPLWFVENDPEMVFVINAGTPEGTLYETKQACFEERVKPQIEDYYEDEDFYYVFTEEELNFMEKNYPNTALAERIAEYRTTN